MVCVLYFCNMKSLFAILALAFANPTSEMDDSSIPTDTLHIERIEVTASLKNDDALRTPIASTELSMNRIERMGVSSIKDMSLIAPNFYQPNYGSSITSSIYVRGFGSRIDQPIVGLNIDEMPIMNKNNYDFDLFDIDRVQVMRGAQSMLFGRNTSGGAINLYTMSPLDFQGKRLTLEYGSANNIRVKASHYAKTSDTFGWSVGVMYNHSDGYFMNHELGKNCDGGDNAALRLRTQWIPNENWNIDNVTMLCYINAMKQCYAQH